MSLSQNTKNIDFQKLSVSNVKSFGISSSGLKKLSEMTGKNQNIELSDNARTVLTKRYLRRGTDGKPVETIEQMFDRIARVMAEPDAGYRDVAVSQTTFYNLLTTKRFFPNSPTFTGAGTPIGQLAACFVLPISDNLGEERDSIFSTLRVAALIQKSGGGNGFSFSDLRSKSSFITSSGGKASGPVGFMRIYDAAFGEVAQGGVRRGANMGVLKINHPDIREFISCKSEEGKIANFNISVAITDEFMNAVLSDSTYDLIEPHTQQVVESPRAREIFEMLITYAHRNGEPGVLYIDAANRQNPVPHKYELKATNPCGEQYLGPYESCCLGSINLSEHIAKDNTLDWELLAETIEVATRFLDNVVTANKYVAAVPEIKDAAMNSRRIGLGFMGLGDAMYAMGIRYGSEAGQELASQISEFIRFHSMKISIALAEERGAFPFIKGSIYDPEKLLWEVPTPVVEHKTNFNRPSINWNEVTEGLKASGIRNATQLTVAPTGTISTVAGIEAYGCEPVFALAYYRNVYQAAGDEGKLTLTYTSPTFDKALDKLGLSEDAKKQIVDRVITTGTCQDIAELPESIRNTFVVSADIKPEEHVRMQASIQAFVDNSISKTCNFPEGATAEDVANVYVLGWQLGCKGMTVYVTGSRDEVVLETKEVKNKKAGIVDVPQSEPQSKKANMDRGYILSGNTYKIHTPQGTAFITINRDDEDNPFELFINIGKAGSDISALSEAMGRIMSCWLKSSTDRVTTSKEMVKQLLGIGGSTSVGFGKNRVSSIPDAVAKILADDRDFVLRVNGTTNVYSSNTEAAAHAHEHEHTADASGLHVEDAKTELSGNDKIFVNADVCPECGNSTLVKEEGCRKCYSCNFSAC